MKTVRWGLLSTAHINRALIPAIRSSKRGKLVAVASRDINVARAYAQEWEIPVTFGSYQEMVASDEIDVIYISLPNHLHAEWSIKAMKASKHVLCEKPLALTAEEVDRMIAAQKQSGCYLAEAFMYLHHPQTRIVGEWVRGGKLGDISLIKSYFSFMMKNREGNIRLAPQYGGGSLWDIGIYPISFSQYIMGGNLPEWVAGSQWTGPSGVDEDFAGMMVYPGGSVAQIGCSFRTPYNTSTEIIGTDGKLVINRPFTQADSPESSVLFISEQGQSQKINVPQQALYSGEVEDMHDAILDGKTPSISLQASMNHIKTAVALYQAASSQTIVRLEGA